MSKKRFREALEMARSGRTDEAVVLLGALERGFVRRRLTHYKNQPDHREAAMQLEATLETSKAGAASRLAAQEPVASTATPFAAPLSPSTVAKAPTGHIDFDAPEPFLEWVSADWDRVPNLDLDGLNYTDVWALVALGALSLEDRPRRPPFRMAGEHSASRFAHALGLGALAGRGPEPSYDEPSRTVRLTRVRRPEQVESTAEQIASMVISGQGPHDEDVRLTLRYVLVELLRNVLQHSEDPLGAVAAAQRMDRAQRRSRPMVQIAVADAGIGIPRHLQRAHPHLKDYRQALERALLPHISGTFAEGLSGSFENAGLGLYMISELARSTGGRLLIATTGAALVLQGEHEDAPGSPRFLKPPGLGFPGTLVSFEIPTDLLEDYHQLMGAILQKARERTPKRASHRWLSFDVPSPGTERVEVSAVRENTLAAAELARSRLSPTLTQRRSVQLDFNGIELCTQSFLHALLFEPVRLAWALRVPIHVVNADPAVTEGLRFLEAYALGG